MKVKIIKEGHHHYEHKSVVDVDEDRGKYLIAVGIAEEYHEKKHDTEKKVHHVEKETKVVKSTYKKK